MFGAVVWGEGWRGQYISEIMWWPVPGVRYISLATRDMSPWPLIGQSGAWLASDWLKLSPGVSYQWQSLHHKTITLLHILMVTKTQQMVRCHPGLTRLQTPEKAHNQKMQCSDKHNIFSPATYLSIPNLYKTWLVKMMREHRDQRPHRNMSGPGALPAVDNHLICLSDKTWIILKYNIHPFLGRETKNTVRCSWSYGSRGPLMVLFVRPVSTRRCKWPVSGLWQYDTSLMASPLFMALSVLSVFGIFPWYLCSESCCRPFNPT